MRILITGSRRLEEDYDRGLGIVARAITVAIEELVEKFPEDKTINIIHGGSSGADSIAGDFAHKANDFLKGHGISVVEETHRADWRRGAKAGPERNQRMVELGANICLAFPDKDSKGTLDCINKAKTAGIPVKVYKV